MENDPLDIARFVNAPSAIGGFYATDPTVGSLFVYDAFLVPQAEIKDLNIPLGVAVDAQGRILVGHARRTAGEDDAPGGEFYNFFNRFRAGMDLAVNLEFPNPAGDELGVLAPEIEDQDLFFVDVDARHFVPRVIQNPKSKIQKKTGL